MQRFRQPIHTCLLKLTLQRQNSKIRNHQNHRSPILEPFYGVFLKYHKCVRQIGHKVHHLLKRFHLTFLALISFHLQKSLLLTLFQGLLISLFPSDHFVTSLIDQIHRSDPRHKHNEMNLGVIQFAYLFLHLHLGIRYLVY